MGTKLIVTIYSVVVNSYYKILFAVFIRLWENVRKIEGFGRKKFWKREEIPVWPWGRRKNFGKIKKAEIDVSNFVVFTGKNNSGKSSMLQLLYGLLQRLPKLEILIDDYEIDENTELELKREKKWF